MMYAMPMLVRRILLILFMTACAVAISACSSTSRSASPLSSGVGPSRATPATFTLYSVDHGPNNNTQVFGINDEKDVVGVYQDSNGNYVSFTSSGTQWPNYTSFERNNYPDAQSTYMSAIAPSGTSLATDVEGGWAEGVGGLNGSLGNGSIWAVVDNNGLWSLIRNYQAINGSGCTSGELFGINDSHNAVGYYLQNGACNPHAYVVKPGESEIPITISISGITTIFSSEATGINNNGDKVGFLQSQASGPFIGWYFDHASNSFSQVNYPGSPGTQPWGINVTGTGVVQIVGSYKLSGGKSRGFVFTPGTSTWTSIDYQNGSTETQVRGINSHGYICGYYKDSNGYHGFVGQPGTLPKSHRRISNL